MKVLPHNLNVFFFNYKKIYLEKEVVNFVYIIYNRDAPYNNFFQFNPPTLIFNSKFAMK